MNMPRFLFSVVEILLGTWMFIYGGYDDSPGAQGLGLFAIILGIMGIVKSKTKKTN